MPETTSPIYINSPQESRPGRIIFILAVICLLSIASSIYLFYSSKKAPGPGELVLSLNEAIARSNGIIEDTNQRILSNIRQRSRAGQDDASFAAAKEAMKATDEFVAHVEGLKKQLYDGSHPPGRPDDGNRASFLLVGTENAPGKGYELMEKVRETREKLAMLMNSPPDVSASIPLEIDENTMMASEKGGWAEYHFGDMPAETIVAVLTKFQNDAKASANFTLNYLLGKAAGEYLRFDAFEPVASATRGIVMRGERYSADIVLSPYSTFAGKDTKVYVNGNSLPVEGGKAVFQTTASSIGTNSYQVRIEAENPLTGETELYEKEFEYEVGERALVASAEKMNVFYIGVDNPLAISAVGVSPGGLNVSISGGGGSIRGVSASQYVVNVNTPGECRVNISGGGMNDSRVFRVKRIPGPVARLSRSSGGAMSSSEFKAQGGVGAFLDGFDFDATCTIQAYKLTYIAPRQEAAESANAGARYNEYSRRLANMAKPGDVYFFDNVKALCPGDNMGRPINSMVFKIQ